MVLALNHSSDLKPARTLSKPGQQRNHRGFHQHTVGRPLLFRTKFGPATTNERSELQMNLPDEVYIKSQPGIAMILSHTSVSGKVIGCVGDVANSPEATGVTRRR